MILARASYGQRFTFGAEGGLAVAGGTAKEVGITVKGRPGIGFDLGAMADYALPDKRFSVMANLTFQYQTASDNDNGQIGHIDILALTLPVDIVYHTQGPWVFGLGPYAARGLHGHFSGPGQDNDFSFSFGKTAPDYALAMDYGLDLVGGYHLQPNMLLTAKFDLGIRDVSNDRSYEHFHTRNFALNFVYLLPGKK